MEKLPFLRPMNFLFPLAQKVGQGLAAGCNFEGRMRDGGQINNIMKENGIMEKWERIVCF